MISSPLSPTPPFLPPFISSDHLLTTDSLSSFTPPFRRKLSTLCYSWNNPNSSDFYSSPFLQFFSTAAKILDNFDNSLSKKDVIVEKEREIEDEIVEVDDWDRERWALHFREIDEQDRFISLLKVTIIQCCCQRGL